MDRRQKMMFMAALLTLIIFTGAIQAYAAGEPVTIVGEVIDTYCYGLMAAKGPGHRECATECAKKGIPMGLLEDGTNKVYVLLPNKDKTSLPKAVLDKMAQKLTITGKAYVTGGSQFLTVESIK